MVSSTVRKQWNKFIHLGREVITSTNRAIENEEAQAEGVQIKQRQQRSTDGANGSRS